MEVFVQLGVKSSFGKWVLIVKTNEGCEIIPITKKQWDSLRSKGVGTCS